MRTESYQQLILEGLEGLPPESLVEIADFVYFVRKRLLEPDDFQTKLESALVRVNLRQWSHQEGIHLEEEFKDYDQLHPHERVCD